MKRYIFLIQLFLILAVQAVGQESTSKVNYEGKDITSLKHAWSAQWITHPDASTLDYNVFLYRRNFELNAIPNEFIIHVSADNRYRLFVNGRLVSTGPARGDINHWRYETVDIAPFLENGDNVLAAEVVNFGEFRHAAQQTFQAAFILQGPPNESLDLNTSASSPWKVTENKAYDFIPFISDSVGGYYAAGPGDRVDGALYPSGWRETAYDDAAWHASRSATIEFAVGRGFLYGSTWFLVPREIPQMEEYMVRFPTYIPSHSNMDPSECIAGNGPLIIPPNQTVRILLDNTLHTIGYPELHGSQGKGSSIKITYAEALFYADLKERVAHTGWKKGPRNEFEGKEIRGIYDIYLPSGSANFLYKPLAMRTYRFVQLDIQTKDEPLVIEDFYGVYTGYPFEEVAKFDVGEPVLKTIWNTAWRTMRNSSTEIFIDPYYEQLQYIGDTRIESMISIYVSGDDRLMRKAIKCFDDSRLPNGLTQSRYPSYIVQVIPTFSLFWVDMIHDYFMYRDDPEFLRQFLPGMESVLAWFERKTDETGMLTDLEWWNFTDWTEGFQNGIPPGADDGYSANVSMQYVYALRNAARVFYYFDLKVKAKNYEELADKVQAGVLSNCFDQSKGLIAERPEKDVFSQHTNVFAVLAGVFSEGQSRQIMEHVLTDTSLIQGTIYFRYYLTAAMQKVGLGDQYLSMLSPWKNMLGYGLTTFGEVDDEPRSDCHAWSASPCFNFLHTVAGIQPSKPGFSEVLIAPNPADLEILNVEFPHPKGLLTMELSKVDGRWYGEIKMPDGVNGEFIINKQKNRLQAGINVIK